MANWLEFDTCSAPNPDPAKDPLRLRLSAEMVSLNSQVQRSTVIYQAWCHVFGALPPINNIAKVAAVKPSVSLTTLHDAIACFGGLRRPHDDEKDGNSVLVYVLNPRISLEYSPSMVCLAQPVAVPSNAVLTVQVRPNFPLQQGDDGINGLVTRLEFVFRSETDTRLPRDFDSRYGQTFWVKQP